MATYYVSSVVGTNVNGSTWLLAYTTIAGALTAATADGDTILVDSAHSFSATSAAISYDTFTASTHISVISVNRNGSTTTGYSAYLAGATEIIGTNVFGFNFLTASQAQSIYFNGITFSGNSGNSSSNTFSILGTNDANIKNAVFDGCTFNEPGTNSAISILIGSTATASLLSRWATFKDCTFSIRNVSGTTGAIVFRQAKIDIINPTITYQGATKPAFLFGGLAGTFPIVRIMDGDISGYEKSGGFYFDTSTLRGEVLMRNIKISATPGLNSGAWVDDATNLTLLNVDSGNTNYIFQYLNRLGTLTASNSIYDNSGALFSSSGISWKIVTTSSVAENEPFITPWLLMWSSRTSSTTASFKTITDNATGYTDRNLWGEFEYVSGASTTIGTLKSVRNSQPFNGTGTTWAADTDTWTGTGGFSNPNKQAVSATFTPGQASTLRARLVVAVASSTLYVNPSIVITGTSFNNPARWINEGCFNEAIPSATQPGFFIQ